jgi:DNA repair exonuclease SbcCD ATPase subunit
MNILDYLKMANKVIEDKKEKIQKLKLEVENLQHLVKTNAKIADQFEKEYKELAYEKGIATQEIIDLKANLLYWKNEYRALSDDYYEMYSNRGKEINRLNRELAIKEEDYRNKRDEVNRAYEDLEKLKQESDCNISHLVKKNERYEDALKRIASDNVIWEQTQVIALRALGEPPFEDIYSATGVPNELFGNQNSNASQANTYPIIEKDNSNEKNE